jgi:hypothetical protein
MAEPRGEIVPRGTFIDYFVTILLQYNGDLRNEELNHYGMHSSQGPVLNGGSVRSVQPSPTFVWGQVGRW